MMKNKHDQDLELKNAELEQQLAAKNRDLEIEASLERVRARTMAMQKSDELSETAYILFQQFKELGENPDQATIGIINEEEHVIEYWVTMYGSQINEVFKFSIDEPNVTNRIYIAWKKQQKSLVIDLTGKELDDFTTYRAKMGGAVRKKTEKRRVINVAFFSKGLINVQSTESRSKESIRLLERFAGVFDGTYTRFLDLQKAEAQAREAQIELALERVRARTMAMYHSEELAETAAVLFEQLSELGNEPARIAIWILDQEKDFVNFWATDQDGDQINISFKARISEQTSISKMYAGWKEESKFLSIDLQGKELAAWVSFCREKMGIIMRDDLLKKRRVHTVGYFSQGWINYTTHDPLSADTIKILERFSAVFDHTYTRFLDLQKAEAQAREAQIELALERVRARTMAMQHSSELKDAASILFQQVEALGISTWTSGFQLWDEDRKAVTVWTCTAGVVQQAFRMPVDKEDFFMQHVVQAGKNGEALYVEEISGKALENHYNYMAALPGLKDNFESLSEAGISLPSSQVNHAAFFTYGYLLFITYEPMPEAYDIFKRFAKVFDQTYTRFLDLQKAEAQAREAQIENALEKVRSRSLAMHKADELQEVVNLVFEKMLEMGIALDAVNISIPDEKNKSQMMWVAVNGIPYPQPVMIPYNSDPVSSYGWEAWFSRVDYISRAFSFDEKNQFFDWAFEHSDLKYMPTDRKAWALQSPAYGYSIAFGKVSAIWAVSYSGKLLDTQGGETLKRFGRVFEQAYVRFLDLQKAEAQASESQIQLALERVRARTMAMQRSDELAETATVLFQQLLNLGISSERTFIGMPNDVTRKIELLGTEQGGNQMSMRFEYEADATYAFREIYKAWQEKRNELTVILRGKNLDEHVNYVRNVLHMPLLAQLVQKQRILYNAFFSKGLLMIVTPDIQSKETFEILKRFAGVFDGTYTRFLDLQRAEEQAREAQIELSLERVRAKTMAMHTSEHVGETVATMYDELVKLGIEKTVRCGILIIDETKHMEVWTAAYNADGKVNMLIGRIDMMVNPMLSNIHEAWRNKEQVKTQELASKDLKAYYKAINDSPEYPVQFDLASLPARQTTNAFFFPEGAIFAFTLEPLSADAVKLFKRFAGVFGQTYRRYLDLQKAEAAAREAQIEAALERVRGKAMAMRSSGDLNDTINTVFIELRKLGVDLVRCGLGLIEKESHISTIHAATNSAEGGSLEVLGNIDMNIHPVLEGIYNQWRQNKDYFPVLEEESLRTYYEKLHESGISVPEWKSGEKQYGYFLQFAYGSLYAWSGKQESEITIKTLKRFTSVIGLTYTRYIELQKAESNTKEAIKQASLDRVRAEIASMRKRSDLERITPLIWDELTILGIPFIRCGVFIMDEEQKLIHTFLSTPDGKAIGAFHIPFDTSGNFEIMVDNWRHKEPYIDHWKEEAFSQFADALVKQGAIASKAQYMRTLPHEGVHLNFLSFLQGMLYVGNIEPLAEDNIDLIQAVADAFSTAYARYEDFNKLEAAKQQVDNTLIDLKAAQTKLIQSEKMASLGELTAGIAHEIQNPLNFVNNFSEVNQEMIDELEEELKAGNIEEALAIAADIKQNEEKISHHGKRADGIVKGMLQHSRTGGGEKQLTNMNTLADEFLRLSYHGLRAKDKTFNAEMVTHFDPDLPKISVIAQDMGRVLLNLFNNAFYAVNQKKKTAGADYKPEASVTTSSANGQVTISVKDNGIGMPEAIKEKIMQPFFTTKPADEGTGLGLSLTYDMVVKGHGGSIQVESTEGQGSEFIIILHN